MSAFNAFDLFDPPFFPSPFSSSSSSFFCSASSLWDPRPPSFIVASERHRHLDLALDLLDPNPSLLDLPFLDAAGDLIHFEAAAEAAILFRRAEEELRLRSLCDRVTALELGFTRALGAADLDRKYKWTTEIKGRRGDCADRKYTWTAEAKGGEERALKWTAAIRGREEDCFDRKYKWAAEEAKCGKERNVKWTAEFKGKGRHAPVSHTYTFETSTMPSKEEKKKKEKKEEKKTAAAAAHVVEIEENNAGAIAMRKAFARSTIKGKRKELSAQDAALIIQMTFRAHLVRRSQVLRCLRDLAVAKAKLKELRALFSNFSYRRRITNDAEERQRFSEKIIVLLLTVDAIEGPDYMVRAAKKSMVLELEAMLEVVDPQPCGKLGSLKRRTFDLPDGLISKEMATGVAEVVHMIDREENE